MTNAKHRLRLKLGIGEYEVESDDKEWAAEQMEKMLSGTSQALERKNRRLIDAQEEQPPLFIMPKADTQTSSPKQDASASGTTTKSSSTFAEVDYPDICTFYRKHAVKGQSDEIALITYWYKRYRGKPEIDVNDFLEAYNELQYEDVFCPDRTGVTNRIQNAKRKAVGYIISRQSGAYSISRKGEERVKKMQINAA